MNPLKDSTIGTIRKSLKGNREEIFPYRKNEASCGRKIFTTITTTSTPIKEYNAVFLNKWILRSLAILGNNTIPIIPIGRVSIELNFAPRS